jgi:hypothetical protein
MTRSGCPKHHFQRALENSVGWSKNRLKVTTELFTFSSAVDCPLALGNGWAPDYQSDQLPILLRLHNLQLPTTLALYIEG